MKIDTMKNPFFGSRRKRTVVSIISLILFVSVVAFVIYQSTQASVVIEVQGDDKKIEVSTHAQTVKELFAEENLQPTKYDKITPSLETEIVSGMTIEWDKAVEVSISVDGNQTSVWTTEKIVKNILDEANIEVTEHDAVSNGLDTEVGADNKIDIQKAFQLTLVDGLEERQVWSTSTTVANFLKQQGVQLSELDRVDKNLEDVITPDEKITVVRVEKVTDVVEESIDFATEKKHDSSLLKGNEKVVSEGKKGTRERTYEIVKENGVVVSKIVKEERVVQQPTAKVVAVGTQVVTAAVSRGSSAEPTGGREFYVSATAYTPFCAGCSGITATGLNVKANPNMKVVAVDPNVIPLGSKVWVEGYGYAVAGDTGGAIKGNKIDLLVPTTAQAKSWGRRTVKIKVLN